MTPVQSTPPRDVERRRGGLLSRFLRRLDELVSDHKTGRWNEKKIGALVVGVVWTAYMVRKQPDSVEMWMAYAGVMLTWSTATYALKRFNDRADGRTPQAPQ